MAEELRAAERDVRELEARAAAVRNADIEYEIALAEKSSSSGFIRDRSPPSSPRSTAERDARIARRQIVEALNAARTARQRLVMIVATLATVDGAELGAAQHLLGIDQRAAQLERGLGRLIRERTNAVDS